MKILLNHIGFERSAPKSAVILIEPSQTEIPTQLDVLHNGAVVKTLPVPQPQTVDEWHQGQFSRVEFNDLTEPGHYQLRCQDTVSADFEIGDNLLLNETFSDLLHYFKSQRCSGSFDEYDRSAPVLGSDKTVDAHGGWYDASGDVSKYLSHLSYANYLNPQQIPMVVWNLFKSADLDKNAPYMAKFTRTRLLDEAYFGADFLMRMLSEEGYFYMTLFDKWSKDTQQREICAYETQLGHKFADYQAGFRQGGGIAIAALAAASRQHETGEYTTSDYLSAAQRAYAHLCEFNTNYLDDGTENIIDFYCALLAAVELYRATNDEQYLFEARRWSKRLIAQQVSDSQHQHYWAADVTATRPFYHAAEAGLPVISLCEYLAIETDTELRNIARGTIEKAVNFELGITQQVHNPFGYPRQVIQGVTSAKRSAYFVAQDNESGYWWQGENARLGSLAAMANVAMKHVDTTTAKALQQFSSDCINWILGNNPYDMCMLDGKGRNNPDYLPELGFYNAKGGICNGITAGFDNPNDIAFNPDPQKDDMLQNWRWGEQWIPHAAWYLLAVTTHAAQASTKES